MRKNHLIQHYLDKLASFHLYFKRTLEGQEIEDIHQLRVTIKKLRAMYALMELATRGTLKKKECFALFSKLFDEAGKVRDAQVSLSIIERSKARYLVSFAENLRTIQKHANEKLLTSMQAFDFKRLEMLNNKLLQAMKELSVEIVIRESVTYILKEVRNVYVLKDHLPDNRKLHKIRIRLKAVIEILTIMNELDATLRLEELRNNFKSIEKQIGKWHDYIILLASLNYFTNQTRLKSKVGYLTNLIGRIETQQEVRQQAIHQSINKYITQQQLEQIENLL
ncbi:CHAD domain-containing protein [Fulvivirgaceae bacterium BMA10]|uniref:CHAD domain-containing protein n=1 Tax=Splendidivirga corallicola TaxID=3051826 RepID=A0ABT8KSU4_9BACT|nr:CHAD domain-containing protein [Fulvivirgaceae bacterium BMA10]